MAVDSANVDRDGAQEGVLDRDQALASSTKPLRRKPGIFFETGLNHTRDNYGCLSRDSNPPTCNRTTYCTSSSSRRTPYTNSSRIRSG